MPEVKPITIEVDLKKKNYLSSYQVRHGDNTPLTLVVLDDGEAFDLTDIQTTSLAITRLDKQVVVLNGVTVGNEATFELGGSELSVPGRLEATAQFYDAEGRTSTVNFQLTAVKDPTGEGFLPSEDEATLIQVVLGDGPLVIEQAQEAADYANTQGDYALQVAVDNETHYLNAVETVALRDSTYPTPAHGDTVRITELGRTDRYVTGTGWVTTDVYNPVVVDEITAQLAEMANNSYVYMSDYANGDNTNETTAIQQALNDSVGRTLYWNKQKGITYLSGQLVIPSNIRIEFEPGTKVKAADTLSQTSEPKEVLFKMLDNSNVLIEGNMAELSMNKAVFAAEHNHIFSMSGVTNVEIKNIIAKNGGGDGFWIGGYLSVKGFSERVRLINCIADNNRRNNLSITSGDDIYIENCTFSNASGADPQSGLDIEPNSSNDVLRKIRVVNCKTINNAKEGFMVSMGDSLNPLKFVDIVFENCYSIGDNNGFRVKYIRNGVKGNILFKKCIAEDNEYNSFNFINCSSTGLKIEVEDCIGVNANTLNTSTGRNAGFLVEDSSVNTPATVGNVHFTNCRYIDRRTTPTVSYGFRVFPNLVAHKKFSFIDCYSEGQSAEPFNFSNTATDVIVKNERKYQYDKTATSGLDNGLHNGQTITNKGATGAIKLTLKNAIENVTIQVKVVEALLLKVFPVATEQILTTSTVGYGLTSSQKGASITLKGTASGTWEVVSMVGTWTESAT